MALPVSILAAGNTAADSTVISVVAGTARAVSLFVTGATGVLPDNLTCTIYYKSAAGSDDIPARFIDYRGHPVGAHLNSAQNIALLQMPGDYFVRRPLFVGTATGVQVV